MPSYHHNFVEEFCQKHCNSGGQSYDIINAVETGTHQGDATLSLSNNFEKVYTIELDEQYYNYSKNRLRDRNNITFYHGNSADVFQTLIPTLEGASLFWLDAHFMGNTQTDWANSPWKGYTEHSGCINNDPSNRENQNPLDKELDLIYRLHKGPALLYIDDLDKFDDNLQGLRGKCFVEEDWTHINLNKIIERMSSRVVAVEKCHIAQMFVLLNAI